MEGVWKYNQQKFELYRWKCQIDSGRKKLQVQTQMREDNGDTEASSKIVILQQKKEEEGDEEKLR